METMIASFIFTFFYALLLLFSAFYWRKKTIKISSYSELVTVVVAFRNESNHLETLIESFSKLAYDNVEFILVNDHSDDDSCRIIEKCLLNNMRLLHLPDGVTGKKEAITYAVKNSSSDYILVTDADCKVSQYWIDSMLQELKNNKRDWQAGPIKYREDMGFFNFFQRLESVYLVMISGWTMSMRFPTTCNGANVMFRKSVFLEVNGYRDLMQTPSGDDEMLMQKINAKGYQIGYCTNHLALVETEPALKFGDVISQRIRWSSKLKHSKSKNNLILALFILVFHVSIIIAIISNPSYTLEIIAGRLLVEFITARIMMSRFRMCFNIFYFLISFFVYPLYVIFMSFVSQVKGFTWKGRKY